MRADEILTILSDVPARPEQRLWHRLLCARNLLIRRNVRMRKHTGGPRVVQRNLIAGLGRIAQPYRLNPPPSKVTPYVGVLSNIEALKWAIEMKRRGKIERLVAGPNLVVTPDEHDGILESPLIDWVVVPCDWVKELYSYVSPSLKPRLQVWDSGVDEEYWRPSKSQNAKTKFLIYQKVENPTLWACLLSQLTKNHLTYHILRYKYYTEKDYRTLLDESSCMVYLSESESQGLALFEAWACNVPTLVWDRRYWRHVNGRYEWVGASSAPYLTAECGLSFKDEQDLPDRFAEFLCCLKDYTPRQFILNNHTLAQAAHEYKDILL